MDFVRTLTALKDANQAASQTEKAQKDPRLWKAVKEFESLLTYQMLKTMRETVSRSELTEESPGRGFFESMFDQEISKLMAGRNEGSLANILYRQLQNDSSQKTPKELKALPERLPEVVKKATTPPVSSLKRADKKSEGALPKVKTRPEKIDLPKARAHAEAYKTYSYQPLSERLKQYKNIVEKAAGRFGMDKHLIYAVIATESSGNPATVSSAGAKGLMQLMDETASDMGVKRVMEPYDNIMGGTRYLSKLLRHYNGDLELTLAGYNAGPGNVHKYGGIPPFRETQNYVKKVQHYYKEFKASKIL